MSQEEFDDRKVGLSIASFIFGIASIPFPFIGIILGLAGLILGSITLNRKQGIKGLAVSGVVTSIIGCSIWTLLLFGMSCLAMSGVENFF